MADLIRRFVRPARKQSIFRTERAGASNSSRVFLGLVVCLMIAALLSSARLVSMAERQAFGPSRDRWLAAAEAVDAVSSGLALDRPAAAVETALGRGEDDPMEVVLGELAAPPSPTAAPASSTTVAAPSTTSTTSQASTTSTAVPTTAAPTTTAPTTLPPILGDVSFNAPLRVWTGGDSLGEYVGSELLNQVADTDLSRIELDFAINTGLARPGYYDWPARLSEVMQRDDRPNVVVFMVGGNDDQNLRVDGETLQLGTPEWRAAYSERVATMMDIAAYPDVQMLWINLPPMRRDRLETARLDINQALEAEAELRPWVQVVDIVDMFTGPGGGYEQFIDAPDGSETRKARANDGAHITRSGSTWVSELVWELIKQQWRFDYLTPSTTAATTASESESTTTSGNG